MQLATTSSESATVSLRPRGHARPVVCGRHLASYCCLVSAGHVSPFRESTHTTDLPEFSTAIQ
jgi:hypothetical protein